MNITIDGYNINYKITGAENSETIVMLQGWGTSLDLYDFIADSLNDAYRFVQFDFPGFGDSDEPREPWNVRAYTDFLCKFAQSIGIDRAHLIAHSYGGRVVIKLAELADENPESLPFEIGKLMLIDSAGIMPERSFSQKLRAKRYKLIKGFLTSRFVHSLFPEVIDYWMSKQGSEDYKNATPIMMKCLVMAVNEDQREHLTKIKQETLLIWGSEDDATPLADAKIMEAGIPNAALIVFEGKGHYSYLEEPARFRSIARSFFGANEFNEDRGGAI